VKGVIIKLEEIKKGIFNKNNIIILNKENKHFIYNFLLPLPLEIGLGLGLRNRVGAQF